MAIRFFRNSKGVKKSKGDITFDIINILIMLIIVFLVAFPFWQMLMVSLNDALDAASGGIYFWPRVFSLESYKAVFSNRALLPAAFITVARTVSGSLLSVSLTALFAYALSKPRLVGRRFYSLFALITMFFSGGLIPYYILILKIGFIDNFLVYIVPGAINVYNMIILRTFFVAVPNSLEESAKIDGASDIRILFKIYIPLSVPAIATVLLFVAVTQWNSWFDANLYIMEKTELLPLQAILMRLIYQSSAETEISRIMANQGSDVNITGESITMATTMVVTLPIVIIYPFVQKYFVKGMMIGSVKE